MLGTASSGVIRAIVIETNGGSSPLATKRHRLPGGVEVHLKRQLPTPRSPAAEKSPPTPATSALAWAIAPGSNERVVIVGSYSGNVAMAVFAPAALRLYAQHDAVYNVTALVDTFGNVDERSSTTPTAR